MKTQTLDEAVVYIIDDDASVRSGLADLFNSVGLETKTFASAVQFLEYGGSDAPACIVLDVRLPVVSGLDFQAELNKSSKKIPIVFITGHGDIPMTVQAMKAGAVEFLTKPFREQDMLDAVNRALKRARDELQRSNDSATLQASFESLTSREQEIMRQVTAGFLNKQIAGKIGLSEIAVKVHRGRMMRKMGAKSVPDLVRMATALGIDA